MAPEHSTRRPGPPAPPPCAAGACGTQRSSRRLPSRSPEAMPARRGPRVQRGTQGPRQRQVELLSAAGMQAAGLGQCRDGHRGKAIQSRSHKMTSTHLWAAVKTLWECCCLCCAARLGFPLRTWESCRPSAPGPPPRCSRAQGWRSWRAEGCLLHGSKPQCRPCAPPQHRSSPPQLDGPHLWGKRPHRWMTSRWAMAYLTL